MRSLLHAVIPAKAGIPLALPTDEQKLDASLRWHDEELAKEHDHD